MILEKIDYTNDNLWLSSIVTSIQHLNASMQELPIKEMTLDSNF